ncbi:MAG: hypothetical protein AM324_001820 [Candidatus Thorarchaeota archaeon SMTZ1-83]|nr:MAG: hypothetical protein AM324_02730 [Candidatus Thorarchaeota archaeon SMTZ1-83]
MIALSASRRVGVSERLHELERIREEVRENPGGVPRETRRYFWKLVRQIKRESEPSDEEIVLAAEVRSILFEADRGRTYRLGPALAAMSILGAVSFIAYLWLVGTPLDWSNVLVWTLGDLLQFAMRFISIFFIITFFYPLGRFIAGTILGIRIEGFCRDEYYEPTLKIDYVSFLKAPPQKRKWFFFFSGIWTIITSILAGVIGFFVGGDITPFIPAVFLIFFEGYVILTGTAKKSRGEMGHYNREKKIERVWKKRLSNQTS